MTGPKINGGIGRTGRPNLYDDSFHLRVMADLVVGRDRSGANNVAAAARAVLAYVPGSRDWRRERWDQAVDRLEKKYGRQRAALEREASARRKMFGSWPVPTSWPVPSLLSRPSDPVVAQALAVARSLQGIAERATILAAVLEEHALSGLRDEPVPDTLLHKLMDALRVDPDLLKEALEHVQRDTEQHRKAGDKVGT